MRYQLPNGRIINISLEDYLTMSDNDFDILVKGSSGLDCRQNILYSDNDSELTKKLNEEYKLSETNLDDELESKEIISLDSIDLDEISKLDNNFTEEDFNTFYEDEEP